MKIKQIKKCDECGNDMEYTRGLLCSRCNISIGRFEDSVQLLESAVDYLKKSSLF